MFKKFLVECLLESSALSRVNFHSKNANIAILTAHRGGLSSTENDSRNEILKQKIRDAGYGYIRVKGHYIEGYGSDLPKDVNENALLVIGSRKDDDGKLLKDVKEWGTLFDQDSVFHKPYDSETAHLYGTSKEERAWPPYGESVDVGKFHPNRMGEFYSSLNKNKTFVFESVNSPSNINFIFEEERYWKSKERAEQMFYTL